MNSYNSPKNITTTVNPFGGNASMYATAGEPAQESLLASIHREIIGATKEILELADQCRSAADSVFGAVEHGCSEGPAKPPRASGLAGDIREQLELHAASISVLRNEIRRLRAL